MSRRILMATVAILALTAPAAAEDQAKPDDAAAPKLEQAQQTLEQEAGAQQGEQAGQGAGAPVTATENEPASPAGQTAEPEQPATTAQGQQPPAAAPTTPEQPAAQAAAEEEEPTPPPDMTFIEVQDAAQFLADEEVIGKDVVNVGDEEVGTIADLVMDQDQKLVGVVLSVGGFLGIGDKWVAVPVDQIDFPTKDQPARLLANVTKEQLENAPDFVTRDVVEAEQEAAAAQQQMQQQQVPPPATTSQ